MDRNVTGRGIGLITSKPITKLQHNKPDAGDGKQPRLIRHVMHKNIDNMTCYAYTLCIYSDGRA